MGQLAARIDQITAANTSGNLLVNASFADDLAGWTIGSATVTDEKAQIPWRRRRKRPQRASSC